jgi:hydrogenase maturation protease
MPAPRPTLRVLVCGNGDRGDDGAALVAIAHVLPRLEPATSQRVEVRRCPQLDPTDLIDVGEDEACLVIDTVVGLEAGRVLELPLEDLVRTTEVAPRSSHALPIQQVLGIAEAVRGNLPRGAFVGIGGRWFGFGTTRSKALRAGLPAFESAVHAAITRFAGASGVSPS